MPTLVLLDISLKIISYRVVMLACRRFEGIHTAENVLTNYEDIITQFNLQGKVGYIITDNAANMLKSIR